MRLLLSTDDSCFADPRRSLRRSRQRDAPVLAAEAMRRRPRERACR